MTVCSSEEEIDEVGAYDVDFHDNDLIPINTTLAEAIKKVFAAPRRYWSD